LFFSVTPFGAPGKKMKISFAFATRNLVALDRVALAVLDKS
jgi:hypothetical protein